VMGRMKVHLPDPEGPMMTNTSPRRTRRLIPRNAWNSSNHFLTFSQTMMSSPVSIRSIRLMLAASTRADAQPHLGPAACDGHRLAHHEIEGGGEQIDLAHRPQELALLGDSAENPEQLEQADDGHQGRVLEHADELAHDGRDDQAQRLR